MVMAWNRQPGLIQCGRPNGNVGADRLFAKVMSNVSYRVNLPVTRVATRFR